MISANVMNSPDALRIILILEIAIATSIRSVTDPSQIYEPEDGGSVVNCILVGIGCGLRVIHSNAAARNDRLLMIQFRIGAFFFLPFMA